MFQLVERNCIVGYRESFCHRILSQHRAMSFSWSSSEILGSCCQHGRVLTTTGRPVGNGAWQFWQRFTLFSALPPPTSLLCNIALHRCQNLCLMPCLEPVIWFPGHRHTQHTMHTVHSVCNIKKVLLVFYIVYLKQCLNSNSKQIDNNLVISYVQEQVLIFNCRCKFALKYSK